MKSSGAMPMSSIEVLPFWRRVLWKIESCWRITRQLTACPPMSHEFSAGIVCMGGLLPSGGCYEPATSQPGATDVCASNPESNYDCYYLRVPGTHGWR